MKGNRKNIIEYIIVPLLSEILWWTLLHLTTYLDRESLSDQFVTKHLTCIITNNNRQIFKIKYKIKSIIISMAIDQSHWTTHMCPCGTVKLRLLSTFSLPYDRHTSLHMIAEPSIPGKAGASRSAFIPTSVSWKKTSKVFIWGSLFLSILEQLDLSNVMSLTVYCTIACLARQQWTFMGHRPRLCRVILIPASFHWLLHCSLLIHNLLFHGGEIKGKRFCNLKRG